MKRVLFLLAGSMFLFVSGVYAYDDHDFQVWNTDTEEFKVAKDAKVAFEEEFRWGNNANEFYYHHYDAGFAYNLNKYLTVGGGYRHIFELKKGKFKVENEPYLVGTLMYELAGFKFDSRSRLEYRHFDYQTDSFRYRNKFTVKLPWKLTRFQIQPYVSDELLMSFGTISQFNQNRFSGGILFNLTKNIKSELYYMLQSTKGTDLWTEANILGVKLKVAF